MAAVVTWVEFDLDNPPTKSGSYGIVTTDDAEEDGIVYTIYFDGDFSETCKNTVGWLPTHYCILEPVPRYKYAEGTDEDEIAQGDAEE